MQQLVDNQRCLRQTRTITVKINNPSTDEIIVTVFNMQLNLKSRDRLISLLDNLRFCKWSKRRKGYRGWRFLKIAANKSENIFDSFENKKVRLFELETSQKHTCCAIHHNVHDGAYPLCHAPFGSFLQVMLLIQLASTNWKDLLYTQPIWKSIPVETLKLHNWK